MTHSFPTRRSSVLVIGPIVIVDPRLDLRHREAAVVERQVAAQDAADQPEAAAAAPGRRQGVGPFAVEQAEIRSEEHTSELQSLMRISYAVFCLKKKNGQSLGQSKQQST